MTQHELELLHRYLDGTIVGEDFAQLQMLLRESADARRMLRDLSTVEAKLLGIAAANPATLRLLAAPVAGDPPLARSRSWLFSHWRPLAWAALLLLACFPAWLAVRQPAPGDAVEVEVVRLDDASLASTPAGLSEHGRMKISSLALRAGEAHLRLPSDVQLVMSGPGEVRFVDARHARVLRGKVTVDVGAHGKGFILDTPVTKVVDLGTRFGVEAKPDGRTDVLVIEGRIELFTPQHARRTAELEQGEAVRVDATQNIARIVNITGGALATEWSTQPPPRECNIVSVSDNFGAVEGFHFYRIVPRGLGAGAQVYTNRAYVWEAADGQSFPVSLTNADVVQTFFGELKRRDYAIELVVARPTDLFVIMPQRGVPQAWLTQDFVRTGEIVVLRERENAPPHPFEVWKRTVTEASTVTLGPPNRDTNDRPVGMYGIAAKSL